MEQSSEDEVFAMLDMWKTFDNDDNYACEDEVDEAIWSNAYSRHLNRACLNPAQSFVPFTRHDIEMLAKEVKHMERDSFPVVPIENVILEDEKTMLKKELCEMCPHSIFEAEYMEENSTYECLLCKLSYLEIKSMQ